MTFIFDRLRGKSKNLSPDATFRITQEGKEKLQEYGGDSKGRVLVALETRGSSDIDEISQASGLTRGEVERLVPKLLRGRYIQFVTTSMVEDGL